MKESVLDILRTAVTFGTEHAQLEFLLRHSVNLKYDFRFADEGV